MTAASSPDPGSFGGHPYTPEERKLGYGTDHDPRFTESAARHHAQPEQDIPSDMTIRTLRWGRSTSSSEAVSAKASTGPHHGSASDSTAAAQGRRDRRWVKRRRPFWTECSLCEKRKAHTLGWHLIRLGWERLHGC